jgi:uncharacterized membrane protein HdeD (DUF308 family)
MAALTSPVARDGRGAPWKWSLALGAGLLVLGLASAWAATMLEVTSLLVFGPMLLASSLLQLLGAFISKEKDRSLHLVAAVPEALLGFAIMMGPFWVEGSLIVWVAIGLLASGLLRLVRSLAAPSRRWGWVAVTGVTALALGLCVWFGWPVAGLSFVGLCLAVDFLCHGASRSALALAAGKPLPESATGAAPG